MRGPVITNLYLSYTLENYKFQKYVYEEKVQYAVIWVLCIYISMEFSQKLNPT